MIIVREKQYNKLSAQALQELALLKRVDMLCTAEKEDSHVFFFPLDMVSTSECVSGISTLKTVIADETFGEWSLGSLVSKITEEVYDALAPTESEAITDNSGLGTLEIVYRQALSALCKNSETYQKSFNPSSVANNILSVVLHRIFMMDSSVARHLSIVYDDGSMAKSLVFPVISTRGHSDRNTAIDSDFVEIPIGLVSERHSDLDAKIHVYWFLNFEISGQNRVMSEVDAYCSQRSKEMFEALRCTYAEPVRLRLYQTGFPVAMIAFYRTFLEELHFRSLRSEFSALELVPMFYRGTDSDGTALWEEGECWHMAD